MQPTVVMTIFVVVAAVAIVIQAGVLIALYGAFKRTSTRVESLAAKVEAVTDQVQTKVFPAIDATQALVVSVRPKVETIVDNLAATTTTVRGQVEKLDSTLDEIVDRTRLQVERADELVTRTMERVEETTEVVQQAVISPVRIASGFLQGVTAGVSSLFGRHRQPGNGTPHDAMFI